MGCWNGTCMISNLPILCGEKVKLVFLHTGYGSGKVTGQSSYVYSDDILKPAFMAIEGEYDDYGSIDSMVDDWNSQLILKKLKSKISKIDCDGEKIKDYDLYQFIKGIERDKLGVYMKPNRQMASTMVSIYESQSKKRPLSEDDQADYERNKAHFPL